MSENELKPCPLCGNTKPHYDGEYVWCTDEPTVECALSMWPSRPESWNYRPLESALAVENERLTAERDELQATYDLFSEAWRRADAIWVAQDPEQRSRRRPGLAEQIVWLVTELEKAEAERDEARRELEEAEEAIIEADHLVGCGDHITDVARCGFRQMPAVRRALERKP